MLSCRELEKSLAHTFLERAAQAGTDDGVKACTTAEQAPPKPTYGCVMRETWSALRPRRVYDWYSSSVRMRPRPSALPVTCQFSVCGCGQ